MSMPRKFSGVERCFTFVFPVGPRPWHRNMYWIRALVNGFPTYPKSLYNNFSPIYIFRNVKTWDSVHSLFTPFTTSSPDARVDSESLWCHLFNDTWHGLVVVTRGLTGCKNAIYIYIYIWRDGWTIFFTQRVQFSSSTYKCHPAIPLNGLQQERQICVPSAVRV